EHLVGVAEDLPRPRQVEDARARDDEEPDALGSSAHRPMLRPLAENATSLSFRPRAVGPRLVPMIKIGINGFGRIGRTAFRAALERDDVQIVAVNDLLDPRHLAYLLRYDSVHGRLTHEVRAEEGALVVDGRRVRATAVKEPAASAWGELDVDVVIESTGVF